MDEINNELINIQWNNFNKKLTTLDKKIILNLCDSIISISNNIKISTYNQLHPFHIFMNEVIYHGHLEEEYFINDSYEMVILYNSFIKWRGFDKKYLYYTVAQMNELLYNNYNFESISSGKRIFQKFYTKDILNCLKLLYENIEDINKLKYK